MPKKNAILLTLNGPDQPGIATAFSQILAHSGLTLLDIEQMVSHAHLFLSILIESKGHSDPLMRNSGQGKSVTSDLRLKENHLLRDLLFQAHTMDLSLQLKVLQADEIPKKHPSQNYIVTCMGPQISLPVIGEFTAILLKEKITIQKIKTVARKPLECIEMAISARKIIKPPTLNKKLRHLNNKFGIDIAVQDESTYRRSKRLLVMDMDSTLIQVEIIDELAKEAGVGKRVAGITRRAMNGEISFQKSLRERVGLLKGLPVKALNKVYRRMPYTLGARELISFLQKSGLRTGVISGGFDYFTARVKEKLRLDYAYANQLEIKEGCLTGKIIGEIVDGKKKAKLVEKIAEKEGIQLNQVIAIGDGSNDLPMITRAGLGIAFNAKPRVREAAQISITQTRLDAILYLLGHSDQDLATTNRTGSGSLNGRSQGN